jgi:hypothetical protein
VIAVGDQINCRAYAQINCPVGSQRGAWQSLLM